MLAPRMLQSISIFLITCCFIADLGSLALPEHATGSVCVLDFKEYPYEPVGECIETENEEVIVWKHVQTTRCCRNPLNALSEALALWSVQYQEIFLTQEQWSNCSSFLCEQRNLSLTSCNYDILYKEYGKCSGLTLNSFKLKYGDRYDASIRSCSSLDASKFLDRCADCTKQIVNLIDNVIQDLQVDEDEVEEKICSIATVIAIASSGITNNTWVQDFYRCLPAMDHGNMGRKSNTKVILVTGIGISGLILLVILIKFVTKKSPDKPIKGEVVTTWSGLYRFSRAEIEKAINYGNNKVCLGSGSAGRVYQGVLPSGQLVAIKQIYKTAMTGSFTREVDGLSRIRHPNLVSLFGCCTENGEQSLVYEYCSNGNLAQNLLRSDSVIPWDKRVKVLRDCALALRFLHTHPDGCIVHRDIKLTNILLTENMDPKLSDFGLAKLLGMEESKVFTDVRGTIGYMDPEYMTNAKLTCASDIYSFGIVTLQLLSGRKVIELDIDARERLTKKAKDVVMSKRPLEDFVDPRLDGDVNLRDFESILRIAVLCVASSSKGRPTIRDVFDEMDRAWQNTLATMSASARREAYNSSAPQSQSLDVVSRSFEVLEV